MPTGCKVTSHESWENGKSSIGKMGNSPITIAEDLGTDQFFKVKPDSVHKIQQSTA